MSQAFINRMMGGCNRYVGTYDVLEFHQINLDVKINVEMLTSWFSGNIEY